MCYCRGVTHSKRAMHEVLTQIRFSAACYPSFQVFQFLLQVREGGTTLRGKIHMKNVHRCPSCYRVEAEEVVYPPHQFDPLYQEGEMRPMWTCGQHHWKASGTHGKGSHQQKNFDSLVRESSKIGRRQITRNIICTTFRRVMNINVSYIETPI